MKFDRKVLQVALQNQRYLEPKLPEFEVLWFDEINSTNALLWQLLSQGTAPQANRWLVAIAGQQAIGRGQWGRDWESPAGGLYLSVAIAPDLLASEGAQLTLCSAIGIAGMLRDRQIPVQIKWLNDLVVEGKKLGGILTESRLHRGRITQAVIGVGINWSNPVPEAGVNLKTLFERSKHATIDTLEDLATLVLTGLAHGFLALKEQGIAHLLPTYESLLVNLGQPIEVNNQSGTILGISSRGHLRVSLNIPEDQPTLEKPAIEKSIAENLVVENSVAGKPTEKPLGKPATEILLEPGSIQLGYSSQLEQDESNQENELSQSELLEPSGEILSSES